jgi:hypothetical protein
MQREDNTTAWELQRPIRPAIQDYVVDADGHQVENVVSFSLAALQSVYTDDFRCPICLGTMSTTWTVTSCGHSSYRTVESAQWM